MKKFIATFVMMAIMAIMIPLSADAQTRRCYTNRSNNSRSYNSRNYENNSRYYQKPNVYDRHRQLINIGAGAGGGALLGGLIGGKKGAIIGALLGGGGGAIYTKATKSRNKYKYYQ
jgi:hypothetical protein